jgi:hypothetical protein
MSTSEATNRQKLAAATGCPGHAAVAVEGRVTAYSTTSRAVLVFRTTCTPLASPCGSHSAAVPVE